MKKYIYRERAILKYNWRFYQEPKEKSQSIYVNENAGGVG